MPITRAYQCPDCEGVFRHLHDRPDELPPAFCPLCGADTREVAPELSAPHIARSIGKTADGVYRAMEDSSAARAEMAAEALGESAAEQGAMRVTNIRDNARPGENSVVSAPTPVSTFMTQTGVGGLSDASAGAQYAAATRGPMGSQGAGLKALEGVRVGHASRAAQMAARGPRE